MTKEEQAAKNYWDMGGERDALREKLAVANGLLRRNLERMKLINGNKLHCITGTRPCPNHMLIDETEEALNQIEDKP